MVILIVFHTCVIAIWNLWGQRLHLISNESFNILASYIAFTGSEQYWDLFATETYGHYQAIIVCDAIQFPTINQEVECTGNVLYKSYEGELDSIQQNRGNQSRSYRFAEQFTASNNEMAYESFLRYWEKHTPDSTTPFLYLIAQFKPAYTADGKISSRLMWALKRS